MRDITNNITRMAVFSFTLLFAFTKSSVNENVLENLAEFGFLLKMLLFLKMQFTLSKACAVYILILDETNTLRFAGVFLGKSC